MRIACPEPEPQLPKPAQSSRRTSPEQGVNNAVMTEGTLMLD